MRINIDTRSVQLMPNRLRQRKKGTGAAFPTPIPVTRSAGALIFFVVRVLGYMNRDVNAVRPVGLGHVNIHASGAQVLTGGIHCVHEHAVILYNSHNDGAGLCTVLFAVKQ